jgi:hypothetical protein
MKLTKEQKFYTEESINKYSYMVAKKEVEAIDEYFILHVKERPWWMPNKVYEWILGRLLVLNRFQKTGV